MDDSKYDDSNMNAIKAIYNEINILNITYTNTIRLYLWMGHDEVKIWRTVENFVQIFLINKYIVIKKNTIFNIMTNL